MMRYLINGALFFGGIVLFLSSCQFVSNKGESNQFGKLQLRFSHDILMDTFLYINDAGNPFLVSEIQYFVSDVKLYKHNGDTVLLDRIEDIHYIDTDLPETFKYSLQDSIPVGEYSKISFIFGINKEKNKSMLFVNPPESFMFWPAYLGGGFHYMKLNGKWRNQEDKTKVFNFHLGIGQLYDENRKIESFVQNYKEVYLSNSAIQIRKDQNVDVSIQMEVNNWFSGPNTFDFNLIGGKIMQNQNAINMACENVNDVFTIVNIETSDLQ
jgi:hypothetical protein